MELEFWDKIRLLVTNSCNYRCPFCHNEGQAAHGSHQLMPYDKAIALIDAISQTPIREICFSGGEPFLHPELVSMIKYASDHTSCDVCCASNISLLKKEQVALLRDTRVKFNIQFPFADGHKFHSSTGRTELSFIYDQIKLLKDAGLDVGLNSVIQSSNRQDVTELVNFALKEQLSLKLLPQLGLTDSASFKSWVFPILQAHSVSMVDKGTGATRWLLQDGSHRTTVLYIDSPCFSHDFSTCKQYGELRVLPDMLMQSCIEKPQGTYLQFDSKETIYNQLMAQWKNFSHC